jgi:hypothetical protein
MADSKRQKIVDAVIARMKLINGSGDYTTDVNDHVEDSRTNWQQDELPAISVFDGDAMANPTSPAEGRSVVHEMPVLIKGFVEQGTTAAACRTLIKDILTAIRVDDRWTVSNVTLVMQSRPVRESITRNPDSFEVEACEVEIGVLYITQKFNGEA